jgi:hypothetical protein
MVKVSGGPAMRCWEEQAMAVDDVHTEGPRPVPHRTERPIGAVLVRVSVLSSVVCGVLTTVHEVWDDVLPGIQQGAGWSFLHTAWLAAMFVAFLGVSAVQRRGLDRLGRAGTAVALVGIGAQTVMAAIEAVTLIGTTPSGDDPPTPVLVAILAVVVLYVAGLVLFAVVTMRAGVLPRSAGLVLLVAVLLKLFASGLVPGTLAFLGIAVAWVGLAAWRTNSVGVAGTARRRG